MIRCSAENFMVWDSKLFRVTPSGPRLVALRDNRPQILKAFHNYLVHWDMHTTRKLVISRFWWLVLHAEDSEFLRSCKRCQYDKPLTSYRTRSYLPFSGPISVISIDFFGPLPKSSRHNRYILVCVEHLTGGSFARATATTTADVVIKIITE